MTGRRPQLGPAACSERDRILFSAHVDAARTFIGSDAHVLPRSTNMRLPPGTNLASSIQPALPWPTPPLAQVQYALRAQHQGAGDNGAASYFHHHDDDDEENDDEDGIPCTCGAAMANAKLAELAAIASNAAETKRAAEAVAAAAAAAAQAAADATAAAGVDASSTIASDVAEPTMAPTAAHSDDASSLAGSTASFSDTDAPILAQGEYGAGPTISPSTTVHSTKSPYNGPNKTLPAVTPGQALPPSATSASSGGAGLSALTPAQPNDKVKRGRQLRQVTRSGTARLTPLTAARLNSADASTARSGSQAQANDNAPLPWEEDDVDKEEHAPTPRKPSQAPVTTHKTLGSSTPFLSAIPCLFVNDIASVLPFYKSILGFTVIGKPDISHAKLRRGDVTLYLRLPPLLPPGSERPNKGKPGARNIRHELSGICAPPREDVHPSSVWINVASVDALFHECLARVSASESSLDASYALTALESYFPDVDEDRRRGRMGRIVGRVENKPWGTREFAVVDADGNRITFQTEIRR